MLKSFWWLCNASGPLDIPLSSYFIIYKVCVDHIIWHLIKLWKMWCGRKYQWISARKVVLIHDIAYSFCPWTLWGAISSGIKWHHMEKVRSHVGHLAWDPIVPLPVAMYEAVFYRPASGNEENIYGMRIGRETICTIQTECGTASWVFLCSGGAVFFQSKVAS